VVLIHCFKRLLINFAKLDVSVVIQFDQKLIRFSNSNEKFQVDNVNNCGSSGSFMVIIKI